MDGRGPKRLDAQDGPSRHCADLVVESPQANLLVDASAFRYRCDGLRRPVEDAPVSNGPTQLDVLGVRPDERPRRARALPEEQFAFGDVGRCPRSAPGEPAVARECLKRPRESVARVEASGRKFVVRALAGQQWPRAADSGAVERAAVGVFAVTVAVVAMPRRIRAAFRPSESRR